VRFQQVPITWRDADRHRLADVRRIILDDELMADVGRSKASGERAQLRLIAGLERDGVGALWEIPATSRVSGSVDELSSLGADREVSADDAVVRQIRGAVVNAPSWRRIVNQEPGLCQPLPHASIPPRSHCRSAGSGTCGLQIAHA
jgi:hypothetical protein